ncbi:hypothetical protein [Pseudomonas mediterranea]|uniref:hypothetical protein n=1 Tax=Pseudomonas mediterranea TaxID=183795 RepID=UPI0006D8AF4E|nr:hypothetical protein [Pseudomonas mediterranea]
MNLSIEKLQLIAALGALALVICLLVVLVSAMLWYFDSCNREMRHERRRTAQLRDRRAADLVATRKRLIYSRWES